MIGILNTGLLLLSIMLVIRRYIDAVSKQKFAGYISNGTLFPLLLGILYLVIPNNSFVPLAEWLGLSFSEEAIVRSQYWSLYFVSVFVLVYAVTNDQPYRSVSITLHARSLLWVKIYSILATGLLILVLLLHGPSLIALRHDRIEAFSYYVSHVVGPFRIGLISNVVTVLTFVSVSKGGRFAKWGLIPGILLIALDQTHGGRGVAFRILVSGYLALSLRKNRSYFFIVICSGIVFLALGLFQRYSLSGLAPSAILGSALGEVYNTRITTTLVMEDTNLRGSLLRYLLYSLFRLLPSSISTVLLGHHQSHFTATTQAVGANYGLAGNILTESYYYGAGAFSIVAPWIVAGIFWAVSRPVVIRHSLGLLLYSLLIANSQNLFAREFFGRVLSFVFLVVFYFIYLISNDIGSRTEINYVDKCHYCKS